MQVSLSPCINYYRNFKAEPKSKTTNVLDNIMAENNTTEMQAKRVKNAVKRCIGVILFLDILYFVMKRNFKFAKIAKRNNKLQKMKESIAPVPYSELAEQGKNL